MNLMGEGRERLRDQDLLKRLPVASDVSVSFPGE